jgi:hypothetical protein
MKPYSKEDLEKLTAIGRHLAALLTVQAPYNERELSKSFLTRPPNEWSDFGFASPEKRD